MKAITTEVDKILKSDAEGNKNKLHQGLILPFSKEYPFCSNGVYFFCGKMGSGKTYGVIRHIMITDRFSSEPYYDQIVVSATSGSMDSTAKTFMKEVSAPLTKVNDTELMNYLNKNVKQKGKYYAICEFLGSGMTKTDDVMERMISKHQLRKRDGDFDLKRLTSYILHKLSIYPFTKYPSNTFLILDDYGGHSLLNKPDSPLANFITKVRHYNYTVCIMCQTWRHICFNLKRLCTDFVIFQGYSQKDLETMVTQSGATQDWREIWEKYKELISPRSYTELHIVDGSVKYNNVKQSKTTLF